MGHFGVETCSTVLAFWTESLEEDTTHSGKIRVTLRTSNTRPERHKHKGTFLLSKTYITYNFFKYIFSHFRFILNNLWIHMPSFRITMEVEFALPFLLFHHRAKTKSFKNIREQLFEWWKGNQGSAVTARSDTALLWAAGKLKQAWEVSTQCPARKWQDQIKTKFIRNCELFCWKVLGNCQVHCRDFSASTGSEEARMARVTGW